MIIHRPQQSNFLDVVYTHSWNPSSSKVRARLSHKVRVITADEQAMLGTMALIQYKDVILPV